MPALLIASNSATLGVRLAERVAELAREAIDKRGLFHVAISGGSLPSILAKGLLPLAETSNSLQLDRWRWYYADERAVPLSHADSNHRLVMEVLLQKLYGKDVSFEAQGKNASNGHSAHVVALEEKLLGNLDDCAADYAQRMEASLSSSKSVDLVLLGMGPDGHTCSLFPGHRDFVETDMRTVVPVRDSPKPPAERISLSMHAVDCARAIAMVCTGDGKKTVVKEIIEGHAVGYPAGRATYGGASSSKEDNGRVIEWFVDTAAASMLDDASVATSGWKVSRVD